MVEAIPDEDIERPMEFRNTGQTDTELKSKIEKLFNNAKNQWRDVFPEYSTFELSDSHLSVKGSEEPLGPGQEGVFVHRLGNLMLLPPDDNSRAGDQEPTAKVNVYRRPNLLIVNEVVKTIQDEKDWGLEQIQEREQRLMKWITETWGWRKSDSGK